MITRQTDAVRLNLIINDPAVRPHIGGDIEGELDFSEAVADPSNIVLLAEHGGMIFHRHQFGLFECHTFSLPAGRGIWTLAMVKECLQWIFCRTEAMEIVTRCPKGNFAAKALARAIGGHFDCTLPLGWTKDGLPTSCDIYRLTLQDWMAGVEGMEEYGREVRDILPLPDYNDSVLRPLGIARLMIHGKQLFKSAIMFNRWAILAGHGTMEVVSESPAAFSLNGCIVVVRDNGDVYLASGTKH
jgi:hypothetical protein